MKYDNDIKFSVFFLSVFWGVYFFLLNVMPYIPGGITEKEESLIFINGWLTVPLAAGGTALLMEYIRKSLYKSKDFFYPALLLTNGAFLFIFVWLVRFSSTAGAHCQSLRCLLDTLERQMPSWQTGEFYVGDTPIRTLQWIYICYPIVNILCLIAVKLLDDVKPRQGRYEALLKLTYFVIPFMIGLALINYSELKFRRPDVWIEIILLSFLSLGHRQIVSFRTERKWLYVLNVLVILLVIFLIFDPTFPIERHHQNHILSPAHDLKLGRSLLVDINCQYGVLSVYFVKSALSILPFSYQGLSLLVTILLIIQYSVVYILLRYLLKSFIPSVLILWLIIEANFFATLGEAAAYPSIGPLRFGLSYLLLLAVAARSQYTTKGKFLRMAQWFVVAVASAWSMETFVYVFFTYASIIIYEIGMESKTIKIFILSVVKDVLGLLFFALIVHSLLAANIYWRSHHLPRWDYYFDYISLYSKKEFGTMLIAPWSPWILFIVIPFASLMALAFKIIFRNTDNEHSGQFKIIAGLAGLSIAQFTYFLGRSHPNNLFHISIPVILLAAYWLVYLARTREAFPKGFYPAFNYCCYFALAALFFNLAPQTVEKLNAKWHNYGDFKKNWGVLVSRTPTTQEVREALYLLDKYIKDRRQAALFISDDDTSEALILSGKMHVFPISYAMQDNYVESARRRVLNYPHQLKGEDMIFLSKNCSNIHWRIIRKLQQEFGFKTREKTSTGIYAVELQDYVR